MATYYWVGGSGNWDATTTTNWASSTGGAGGAGVPTFADDVIFDANSNTLLLPFTVTITGTSAAPSVCNDFSTGGAGGALDGAMTLSLSATSFIDCYGSMTLPATNFTWSGTSGCRVTYRTTTTGKTLTTNGVSLTNTRVDFSGVGGEWTLGSALTYGTSSTMQVNNGTFNTGNFNVTGGTFGSTGTSTRAINLGSSTVTVAGTSVIDFSGSNITVNSGTSTITTAANSPIFSGGGNIYYNVSFTSTAAGTATITGANTFNNLSFASRGAAGIRIATLSGDQIVNGTLTLGTVNTATTRMQIQSDVVGTQRTITLNGTLATLSDVDFRDIGAAGTVATPWTGTRLGNGLNNNNITFDAPKTVYWNLAGSQAWNATAWATTNNGVPAANNFPLAQDMAVFTEAGAAGTVTIGLPWWIGAIQMADGVSNRTTAFTLAVTGAPFIYGNVTLFSSLVLSGTSLISFVGQGITQTITSAGVSFTQTILVQSPSGIVTFADNFTCTNGASYSSTNASFRVLSGTLDLNNKTITLSGSFGLNTPTAARNVAFGTSGKIVCIGNNITIFGSVGTNTTITGTSRFEAAYSGSTGTRTITASSSVENQLINIYVTAGSDILSITSASTAFYSLLDFTGFTGTVTNSSAAAGVNMYGDLILNSSLTFSPLGPFDFAKTSGTQKITSAGKTFLNVTFGETGTSTATYELQDALNASGTLTFTSGTVQLKNGVTSTVGTFATSGTNQKFLQSTTPGSQATLSQASGTVDVSRLTIQDINAVGGATWNAFVNQQNIDAGNNDGWDFGISPIVGSYEYTYQLRSFTQPRRF